METNRTPTARITIARRLLAGAVVIAAAGWPLPAGARAADPAPVAASPRTSAQNPAAAAVPVACPAPNPAPVPAVAGTGAITTLTEHPDDRCDGHSTSKPNPTSTPTEYWNDTDKAITVNLAVRNTGNCPVVWQTTGPNAKGPRTVPGGGPGTPGTGGGQITIDAGQKLEVECGATDKRLCDYTVVVTPLA